MRLFLLLIVASLVACSNSDFDLNEGRTSFFITRKGCALDRSGYRDLLVNVVTDRLPDGRIQCTITTLVPQTPTPH